MSLSQVFRTRIFQNPRNVGIVAAGFSGGQTKPGVGAAPAAIIKDGGLLEELRRLHIDITFDNIFHDYTHLKTAHDADHHGMKRPRFVSAATQCISEQVYSHAVDGRLVLTLGGDHSIGIGSVTGIAKAARERFRHDVGVIWVDAHADINTPETSPSGNIHGMPVAFATRLARERADEPFGWIQEEHRVDTKKLVYIGIRDLDPSEKSHLRDNDIKAFTTRDIDRVGIAKVMEDTIAYLGHDTPLHLCFDIDAIDPASAPSTGVPVPGGLTRREGEYIAESVAATGMLIAVDLVEVNPDVNSHGAQQTIETACSIIRCALGHKLL
ncbi:Arginase, catabolizes arginine to ornithine and urea [Kalmusia sp. IMI 367209]|nr:Arginase, catabolizes arginine to ornithine and urea [Kalmusia sp. IMI 367209]